MSEVADPTLERIEGLFKDLVWDNLMSAAIAAIYVQVPWLGGWLFKSLTSAIVRLIGDKIFSGLKLFVDLQAISLLNHQHKVAFEKSVVTLNIIARNKGLDSQEFKNAREEAKKYFAEFVRFGATR